LLPCDAQQRAGRAVGERRLSGTLKPRREPDGETRAGLDGGGERRIGRRGFGAVRQAGVAVLDLLRAELGDRIPQLRLGLAEPVDLVAVVLVDHFLDRDRAGYGGALAQKSV